MMSASTSLTRRLLAAATAIAAVTAALIAPVPASAAETSLGRVTIVSHDYSVAWSTGTVRFFFMQEGFGMPEDVDMIVPGEQTKEFELTDLNNGQFRLTDPATGRCVAGESMARLVRCSENASPSTWVVQPGVSPGEFLIRPSGTNRCMTHRDIQTEERQFRTVTVDGIASWDCEKANPAQSWKIVSTAGTDLTSLLTTRAAEAATRACGDGFITTCDYTITSQTPAYLGEPQIADAVAPVGSDLSSSTSAYRNGTSNDMTVSFQWSKTLTTGVTITEKHGGSVKVGLSLGKLSAGISYSYSRSLGLSTAQTTVNGTSAFLLVQPNAMVWVVREQLLKQTVGRFSYSDAAGNAWTFDGTVIAPVESADGKTSVTTFCTSDSTTAVCRTARPF